MPQQRMCCTSAVQGYSTPLPKGNPSRVTSLLRSTLIYRHFTLNTIFCQRPPATVFCPEIYVNRYFWNSPFILHNIQSMLSGQNAHSRHIPSATSLYYSLRPVTMSVIESSETKFSRLGGYRIFQEICAGKTQDKCFFVRFINLSFSKWVSNTSHSPRTP